MEYTKERFKTDKKWLTDKKNSTGLCQWNEGYLEALNDYQNLILFGVGRSEPIKQKTVFDYAQETIDNAIKCAELLKGIRNGDYIQTIEDKTLG